MAKKTRSPDEAAELEAAVAYYKSPAHAERLAHDLFRQLLFADNALRQLSEMESATVAGAFPDRSPGTHEFSPIAPQVCAESRSVLAFVCETLMQGKLQDGLHQLALLADRCRRDSDETDHLPKRSDIARALITEASWWFNEKHGALADRAAKGHLPGLTEGAIGWIVRGLLKHRRTFGLTGRVSQDGAVQTAVNAAKSLTVLDRTHRLSADFLENLLLECLVALGLGRSDARNKISGIRQEQDRGGLKRKPGLKRESQGQS